MKRTSLIAAILAIAATSQSFAADPAIFADRHYKALVDASVGRAGMPVQTARSTDEGYDALIRASFEHAGMPVPKVSTAGRPTRNVSSSEYFGLVSASFGRVMPTAGSDRIAFRPVEVSAISDR